jgi:hypothetical protein
LVNKNEGGISWQEAAIQKQVGVLKRYRKGISGDCRDPTRIKILWTIDGQHGWISQEHQDDDFGAEHSYCRPMSDSLKHIVWYLNGGGGIPVLDITHKGKESVSPLIWWLTETLAALLVGAVIASDLTLDGRIGWILLQQ